MESMSRPAKENTDSEATDNACIAKISLVSLNIAGNLDVLKFHQCIGSVENCSFQAVEYRNLSTSSVFKFCPLEQSSSPKEAEK